MTAKTMPQLTMGLMSFSAEDPGSWEPMFAQARAADAAGVDRLVVSDHVVYGERLEEYGRPEIGGMAGGKQPTGPDGHWLEPLTTLSVIAGMTRQIRLRTHILLAALRRPVILAKSTSTLDVLSGGRLDLGVGVGWQREEYEAAGLEFEGRGKLLDHSLEVCLELWRNQRASFDSPLLSFKNIHQMPKPTRPEGVPIWVSGTVRSSTVRRLARYGARWIPWGADAANLGEAIPRVRDMLAAAGGDAEGLQVVGHLPLVKSDDGEIDLGRTMESVAAQVAAGVTDFVTSPRLAKEQDTAEATLRPLVEAFRKAVGR
ncbi:TIGR03619 family F420-dependent LLM class oxidoreductase [Flavisphingomonas formosensis]|uniref:TIGR03619 family F420-dependent LLM class oxidoreductase n=1 Tax=Flavisphingomonas formosensis TaxID=861534 RepID=UPI0018E0071F|nr:TIGR03619 family F420-dependent LLM class oxidoreductase [Sphingomonas formosensis]